MDYVIYTETGFAKSNTNSSELVAPYHVDHKDQVDFISTIMHDYPSVCFISAD